MTTLKNVPILLALLLLTVTSCKKDEDTTPTTTMANFTVTIENVLTNKAYMASGSTGLLMPGESETITFNAGIGSYFSFATMFVQSNDLFYGFDEKGIALYDGNGDAVTGDVTAMVELWDAGTEVNEEPGVGPNQAPRQSGPNTGTDENGTVELIQNIADGFTYPATNTVIKVTLTHDGGTEFTATIENISGSATLPTPFAPGVWAIHDTNTQLFTAGEASPNGLEGLAEDGSNQTLVDDLADETGYVSPFAPGVFVIHSNNDMPLFLSGQADFGDGLEALAEDGDPSVLDAPLKSLTSVKESAIFNTPTGAGSPGPLLPGNTYSFSFTAEEGDYLNFATMLVHTNDLFFAFDDDGIALFNNGNAVTGDVTSSVQLWDAGTEVNEYPGAGNNQPARGGADSGVDENGTVHLVNDGFSYPSTSSTIKVRIQAQ